MRKVAAIAAALAAFGVASVSTSGTDGKDDERLDARCPWGRLANGKGKLVRCITKNEAAWLSLKTPVPASPKPSATSTPRVPTKDGGSKDEPKPKDEPKSESKPPRIALEIGPVLVDRGKLPKALTKLERPKDRYLECISKHGGMFRDTGELHARFLVRQRGRAEGVHIIKRRSVTEAAGKCVADVIDRRLVGRPEAEMVGATLVLKFSKVDD